MYSLDEVLQKCDKNLMINGYLKYIDNIPYLSNEISSDNDNYYIMKYYEGSISAEEHEKINNNLYIREIYNKYIFNPVDVFNPKFVVCDEDINYIIYIRMAASEDSQYLEVLNKLMLRIYFEKKKIQLAGLVHKLYEQYDWAKEYVNRQKENKLSLIFQYNPDECYIDEYNKYYGINTYEICTHDDFYEMGSIEKTDETLKENNWILQKFGG